MKRYAIGLTVLALSIAASASAETRTYFGFQIGIGNAPPPPVVVFHGPPPVYCEPETRVYVVRSDYDHDRDVFRYGNNWYMCNDGYWYRARSYRGPFMVCDVRSVPRPIFYVPQHRWRHYPHSLVSWKEARGHGRKHDGWKSRDHGRDHGRGNGNGKHHDHD